MKRSNVIGILAAAAVIVLSVVLISWYGTKGANGSVHTQKETPDFGPASLL